jgi:hypothetical protein
MDRILHGATAQALPERVRMRPVQAKAALKVPNSVRKQTEWERDAAACKRALRLANIDDQKEAADELGMSKSQLSDQLAARERPQIERFRSSARLYGYILIAQAEQHPETFDVVTTITVRRSL